jgi:hypothetical protein
MKRSSDFTFVGYFEQQFERVRLGSWVSSAASTVSFILCSATDLPPMVAICRRYILHFKNAHDSLPSLDNFLP